MHDKTPLTVLNPREENVIKMRVWRVRTNASSFLSVRSAVSLRGQLGSHWTDFHEI